MKNLLVCFFCFMTLPNLWALEIIQVRGNQFIKPDGSPIVLRGVNSSDPDKLEDDGQWNERYFRAIADWGSNVVRIPVHPRRWRDRTPEKYLELLDQGIGWAESNSLYVILDWHSIGNLKDERFQHEMYETSLQETVEFWTTIADRYRGRSAVAFYEIYNEPTVSGDRFGTMSWAEWKVIQENLIAEIRKIDSETVVLVAGFDWAYDLTPVLNSPIDADNVAYVSHPYPQKREPPWEERWEADWGKIADHYPVFLTEIGFCLQEERGAHIPVISTVEYGHAITSFTEQKGISWVAWVFDVDWSPMLILDWDFTPTTQGQFFKTYLESKGTD